MTQLALGNNEITEILGGPGLSTADAKLVKDLLMAIRHEMGHLTSREVHEEMIKRSRPEDSPTHHLFEWDPIKGHAIYLIDRARHLVMTVRAVFVDAPQKPVRAFTTVLLDGKRGPVPMPEVRRNEYLMLAVIEEAKQGIRIWRKKYENLRTIAELSGIFEAVDKIALVAKSPEKS